MKRVIIKFLLLLTAAHFIAPVMLNASVVEDFHRLQEQLDESAQNVTSNRWEWLALLGVGFLTVYREGFELALFMQSLLLEGNISAVTIGAAVGLVGIALVGLLTFRFGLKLPYRKLLLITGVLVVSVMVSFWGKLSVCSKL